MISLIDHHDSAGHVDGVTLFWENLLLVTITYNFLTCCFFLGLPGFPSGPWTYLEFLTEIVMLVDFMIRFGLRRMLPSQKRTLLLLHDKADDRPTSLLGFLLSSLPSSIVLFATVVDRSAIWLAIVRILKLYRTK